MTDDKPKYRPEDVATQLLAILSEGGFVHSTEASAAPQLASVPSTEPTTVHVVARETLRLSTSDRWKTCCVASRRPRVSTVLAG